MRQAEAVKVHVERLAAAAVSGHVTDAETSRWVAGLDSMLADKLANAGLIAKQERRHWPHSSTATLPSGLT